MDPEYYIHNIGHPDISTDTNKMFTTANTTHSSLEKFIQLLNTGK